MRWQRDLKGSCSGTLESGVGAALSHILSGSRSDEGENTISAVGPRRAESNAGHVSYAFYKELGACRVTDASQKAGAQSEITATPTALAHRKFLRNRFCIGCR